MGAGLKKSLVPVFVGGGIDTKNDPRLVEAGALLELENLYMQRTGELRWRNGYTSLTKSQANGGSMTGISSIFKSQNGTTCVLASTSSGGPPSVRTLLQYDPVTPVWRTGNDANPMPTVNVSVSGMATAQYSTGVFSPVTSDLARPDSAVAGNYLLTCWTEAAGGGRCMYSVVNESTGAVVTSQTVIPGGSAIVGKKIRAVAGGSSFLCLVFSDNAGTPNLIISSINLATMAVTTTTIVAAGVAAAFPTPAVRSKPGSNNVIIAYAASGGGVSCMEVNPATNAIVTGPVNIAAANVTMAMAWLDDQVPTGSYLLATAGAAAGVVTRVLTSAFAVSATNVIDAAATVNVNSVTGYVRTGVADYDVLWDVTAASASYNTIIRRGRWTGAVVLSDYARSFGIVSLAFKGPDGLYYLVASFSSTTQPTYLLLNTSASSTDPAPIASHCNLLNQSAGGANSGNSCPSSVSVTSSGRYLCALTKRPPPDGTGSSHRQIVIARFYFSGRPLRPRELGNTLFIPGGIQTRSDGLSASWSTMPIYPEAPTLTGAVAGGALTLLGTYDLFLVYKRIDATGRITRSAPSTPTTITLTGAQDTINFQVPTLRLSPVLSESVTFEVYRRGPTGSGASTINKVAEGINDPTVDTVSGSDGAADLTAAAGTLLYTTGGVLESFPPPPHSLLEVNATRVWVVNSEDPTELWPSKEYKPGVGIGFHPLLAFRVTGDGYGAITALAAMDGRLIVFKSGAIYVISGDGPDDNGRGSFNPPQAVSLSIGTTLPGSVVATPDGIMFQSSHGLYILTRGLALTYLGKPVEKYTLLENVVDASLVDNATQVRFVQASGRCLVWDYDLQRWYTFLLPVGSSSIVACANISGGWCYGLADGTVKQEVSGQYSDDGVAIVPRITFPNMDTAGINGYQRVYAIQVLGEYLGDHTLTASIEYDYDGIAVPAGQKAITAGPYQYEIIPARKKCSAMKLTLSCTLLSGSGGFRLSGVSLLVGLKHGTSVPYTKRLT